MNPNAKWQLAASFIFCAACGVLFIYTHWGDERTPLAVGRSSIFVLILAAVHLGGFALYARQFQPATVAVDTAVESAAEDESPAFLRVVLLQQIPLLFLTSLLLDGGGTFCGYCVGAIAHWAVIGIIHMRRRRTHIDMIIVRWGFIPIVILTGLMAPLVIR
jgi:hypothetical protein